MKKKSVAVYVFCLMCCVFFVSCDQNVCPKCGTTNRPQNVKCWNCGYELKK